jgi:PhnB protein
MSKPRLVPYLAVKGALDAIKFYEEAFDAEVENVIMANDGKRVLHAALEINDAALFLSDEGIEGGTQSPLSAGGASVGIHVALKKPRQVDRTLKEAAELGATIIEPATDMPWGARYGKLRDPFGHVWSFGAPLKKKRKYGAESEEGDED